MSSETSGFDLSSCSSCSYSSEYCSTCSMNTTPHRRSVSDAGVTVDDIKAELQRDISERFVEDNIDIDSFVRHVWGLSETTIDAIISAAETIKSNLPKALLDAYKSAFDHEPKAYKPFLNISNHLLDHLMDILPQTDSSNNLQTGHGGYLIDSGCNKRKPDMVATFNSSSKFGWSDVIVPFEFKTRDRSASARKSRTHALRTEAALASSRRLFPPQSAPASDSQYRDENPASNTRSASRDRPASSALTIGAPPASSSMPPGIQEVTASQVDAADSAAPLVGSHPFEIHVRSPKKAQADENPTVSRKKSPSRTSRSRASSTSSAKVNLNRESRGPTIEPQLSSSRKRKADDFPSSASRKRQNTKPSANQHHLQLARYVLECMAASSRHYATGVFVDRFDISLWYYDRAIVARSATFNFKEEPVTLALVLYALRSCTPQQAGFNPFIIPASESCPSNIDELFESPTSATQFKDDHVVLVQEDGSTVRFKITGGRLFVNRCLLGRGTQVFPVQAIDGDKTVTDAEKVLKMIWPDDQRLREADMIRNLREAIPEMAQHLPDIMCSSDMTAEQLRLPRHLLGINVAEDLERRLHAIVMSRYQALWKVDTVEEFQDVFVDCVECHYAAYRKGRVLHRDLSINNLMCDKKPTGHIGILSDWDLSSLIDDQNAVIASSAKHRTGTVPFMSIHLLKASPPHKYCHDLESFFYILVWAAIHFDLQKKRCIRTLRDFEEWNHSNLVKAAGPKLSFLLYPTELLSFVSDDFKTLFDTWIMALQELFLKVYTLNNVKRPNDVATWSEIILERLEKYVTFESFMSAIGRKPRYVHT